jgi:IPT/TIG domain
MAGFAHRRGAFAVWMAATACVLACPGQAGAVTRTFYGAESFVVPEGVTQLSVVAVGEGPRLNVDPRMGLGAELSGELAVFPGETLYVHAREANGGDAGEWVEDGGGSSSIATAAKLTPEDVLLTAGGGGGSGASTGIADGQKGGNAGEAGENGWIESGTGDFGEGGAAGTQTAGGIGGLACGSSTSRAGSGRFDQGGNGVEVHEDQNGDGFIVASSGNGGGGYYGGGGGGRGCTNHATEHATEGAGGGGGSSLAPPGWTEALAPLGSMPQVKLEYGPVAAPTVTSVSPGTGKGGDQVEITGTNLESVQAVDFGSRETREFTIQSNTAITTSAPKGVEGTVDVTVTGLEGTSSTEPGDRFSYEPVPTITAITPEEGTAAGGTPVTITGTDFENVEHVFWGGANPIDFTVESETEITAVTPPAVLSRVSVRLEASTGVSRPFTYIYGNPEITSINPAYGPSSGGTLVTIAGERFREVESVTFVRSGRPVAASFTVVSEELIEAVSPPGEGREDVEVTTPKGHSKLNPAFEYKSPPSVAKLAPKSGPTAGGTEVQITGTDLSEATEVHFGSTAVTSFTVTETKSGPTLTVLSPPGIPGKVAVTVTSSWGTSLATKKTAFTYKGTPTITGLSPSAGPTAGGTEVEVSGTGFATGTATTFEFGKVSAPSVDCVSSTSCIVEAPPAKKSLAATVDVVATSGKKKSPTSPADEFTYE